MAQVTLPATPSELLNMFQKSIDLAQKAIIALLKANNLKEYRFSVDKNGKTPDEDGYDWDRYEYCDDLIWADCRDKNGAVSDGIIVNIKVMNNDRISPTAYVMDWGESVDSWNVNRTCFLDIYERLYNLLVKQSK